MKITTNNQYRPILNFWELTQKEQKELIDDYGLDFCESESYFRYKGSVHILGDFMKIQETSPNSFKEWHAYSSDSFFSGLLIKLNNYNDSLIVGLYIS